MDQFLVVEENVEHWKRKGRFDFGELVKRQICPNVLQRFYETNMEDWWFWNSPI